MSDNTTLDFPERLTIEEVGSFRSEATRALAGKGDVVLDLGATTRFDTAGLQLALAIALHLKNADRKTQWLNTSEEIQAAAESLGLTDALGWEQS